MGALGRRIGLPVMSNKDRVGVIVIVGVLLFLGLALLITFQRPTGPLRDFDENVIVQQRIKNLERNR